MGQRKKQELTTELHVQGTLTDAERQGQSKCVTHRHMQYCAAPADAQEWHSRQAVCREDEDFEAEELGPVERDGACKGVVAEVQSLRSMRALCFV